MRAGLWILALLAAPAWGATCTAFSGQTRNSLLELYTSEGCSACPPADRWLSQVGTRRDVVALAFHVDYWDRLGWRDRFAQPRFSARQRTRNRGSGWLYTPQVMLDGADYRQWRTRPLPRGRQPATATLELRIEQTPRFATVHVSAVHVNARPVALAHNASLYIAVYENALVTQVARGENAQLTLRHDYVVRAWSGPHAVPTVSRFVIAPGWRARHLGVAAVLIASDGSTVQAITLPACP